MKNRCPRCFGLAFGMGFRACTQNPKIPLVVVPSAMKPCFQHQRLPYCTPWSPSFWSWAKLCAVCWINQLRCCLARSTHAMCPFSSCILDSMENRWGTMRSMDPSQEIPQTQRGWCGGLDSGEQIKITVFLIISGSLT